MPYVRTVKTKSGATAVQVVWSSRPGSREIEHIGSAHDEAGLETLKAAAREVQEAASNADLRTTMLYNRARTSLERHATYIAAAYVAGAARQNNRR